MVKITIENRDGKSATIEIPCDLNLSLMEALKASGYDILATCGGIALCATCHVKVIKGMEDLSSPNDQELDILEMLPNADRHSRLSCQIRISEKMDGMTFRIASED